MRSAMFNGVLAMAASTPRAPSARLFRHEKRTVLSTRTSTSTDMLTDHVFALMAKRLHRRRRIVKAGTPLKLAGTQSRRSKQIARLVCSSDKSVESRMHTAWQASLSRKSRERGRWRNTSTSTLFGSDSRREGCAIDAELCDGRIGL